MAWPLSASETVTDEIWDRFAKSDAATGLREG